MSTPVIGTDAFQETPIVEVCRAVTKHHYLILRTEDITRVMKEAFYIATSGRPGPIIVDVPKDVQMRKIVADYDPPMNLGAMHPIAEPLVKNSKNFSKCFVLAKNPSSMQVVGLSVAMLHNTLKPLLRKLAFLLP